MRPTILTATLLLVLGAPLVHAQPRRLPPDPCATVAACEQRLRDLAALNAGSNGLDPEEMALIQRLAGLPHAVPMLVALLAETDDPGSVKIAAAALAQTPQIDARWLPQIRAAMDRTPGWLAPALARIPGNEAARLAVAYYLASESAPHNQEAVAVQRLGLRALPHLLAAARCADGCPDGTHRLLASVLTDDPEFVAAAAPELLLLAADPATAEATAAGAVDMIAALGSAAAAYAPPLVELRAARPALAPRIDAAFVALGVPAGAEVIAGRLDGGQVDPWDLVEIARMGANGHAAAAPVVRLLDHPDADTRVSAARTLGYLEYPAAIPALRSAMKDPRDARLALAAAEALGRLHAGEARAELETAARAHWYPPVRAAAAKALVDLDAGQAPMIPTDPGGEQRFAWAIIGVGFGADRIDSCMDSDLVFARVDPQVSLHASDPDHAAALEALAFDSVVLSYGPDDEEAQREAAKARGIDNPVIEVNQENMVEHRSPIRQAPTAALRVPGGWLAGSDRGEWGGELMFVPDGGGAAVRVHDGNVDALFALGRRFVAITGLAHLSLNHGEVLALERGSDGRWLATPWRILPAAPASARQLADGDILIDTRGGGALVLAADGALRMAPCRDGE